jgi:1-acyl-sn-glycerol-3-phosphate acyltransferase
MTTRPSWLKGTVEDTRQMARGFRWGRKAQVPRSAEAFVADPDERTFRADWARTRSAVAAREVVQRAGLEPVFRSQVRTRVQGLDLLQDVEGPVIFAANHASHLDTPLVLLSLPDEWRRRTAVAAAADYFFDTWWRAAGSALLFNTFPIDRSGGTMAATPGDVLADGWNVLIFPEGTRSHDGWAGTFRMGAAFLAHQQGVPVVPVAHRGTFAAMPRGRSWPAPGRRQLSIRFGAPVRPGPDESVRELATRIRTAIAALLDEDRTSWWESQRRLASSEVPDPSGPQVAPWRRVWEQTAPLSPGRRRPSSAWGSR